MAQSRRLSSLGVALVVALLGSAPALAQFIDFETLPGGGATVDQQQIATEYATYGVTFTLLSRTTGEPIGFPRIAKAGPPLTAFEGCLAPDTPWANLGLGTSFLTDGTELGVEGALRIDYATAVAQASGVILDIDCRQDGGAPCEQWTVTAYDASGSVLQTVVLDGLEGPVNPECAQPDAGPGDSQAFGWAIDAGTALVRSIILRYTGEATEVGLAFDNFSIAALPGPPTVTIASPAATICAGETLRLTAMVLGGLPPYAYRWQMEIAPGSWRDLGTDSTQAVQPLATADYRVIVTDTAAHQTTSAAVTVTVTSDDPLCAASLLVSCYPDDRILRFSFRSRLPDVFVSAGSGGLNGPSKLVCGPDHDLYVSSQDNDRILRYDGATGAFTSTFVAAGSGGLDIPIGLDFGPDGHLYVVSYMNSAVLRYDGATGAFIDAFVPAGSGLNHPTGLVFGPDQDLYVCSRDGDKVLRFDGATGAPLGDFVAAGSGGLDAPRGLVFGPDGNLYVSEEINDSVRRYDGTSGAFLDVFIPAGSGGLDRANDVAFGPDGVCYVASYNTDAILLFDGATGAPLGALTDPQMVGPTWFAVGCRPLGTDVPGGGEHPVGLVVAPNVPNPFNPRTTIWFTLPSPGRTRVLVLDVAGRLVDTLLDRDLPAGRHSVQWHGRDTAGKAAPSGVYLVCVECGRARESTKMLLMR